MKKNTFLLFAVVATAFVCATSCDKKGKEKEPEIYEDGMYLLGDATGFSSPAENALFFTGKNEANQTVDARIKEKFIWLETGKTFYIGIVEAGEVARKIGGTATPVEYTFWGNDRTNGKAENEPWGVTYYLPEEDTTFTVEKTGLYHVVYFTGDSTAVPVIAVVNTEWGFRNNVFRNSDEEELGFVPFSSHTRVANGVDFTFEGQISSGHFKVAYNGGWKIPVNFNPENGDITWNVMANTNFGGTLNELVSGGGDIIWKGLPGKYKVTMQWRVGPEHGFSDLVFTPIEVHEPEAYENVGLIGGAVGGWGPSDDIMFPAAVRVDDTYVYTLTNPVTFTGGGAFKIRQNSNWNGLNLGYNDLILAGDDVANFSDAGGDIAVGVTTTYTVTFIFDMAAFEYTLTLVKQ